MRINRIIAALGLLCGFSQVLMASNVADSVTEVKKVNAFTTLKVNGNFNIIFTQSSCSLKITASDQNTMSAIDVKSTPTSLTISQKDGAQGAVTLYIGLKDEQLITLNINGTVSATNTIDNGELSINIDGNVSGALTLDVKMLNLNCSSGKGLVFKGKAKQCNFKDSGEGSIDASELKTDNITLDDSSDGDLKIYAHPEMHVKMEGSGALTYYGSPRIKTFKVSGQATDKQITEGK